jgi:hypothetical protein
MAATTGAGIDRPRGTRTGWQLVGGLIAAVVVFVVLVVPAVTMLLLPPRGFPTSLPDALAVVLFAVAGVVVGLTVRFGAHRPPFAITVAAIMTLLAVWFQQGTLFIVGWLPTPPILPHVPRTLVLVAGVAIGAAVVAGTAAQRGEGGVSSDPFGQAPRWSAPSLLLGLVAAVATVLVVEGDIWGRRQIQQTFQGPWGLSMFRWLLLLAIALAIAGMLLGWVASSERQAPQAPTLALVLLAVTVAVIWLVGGLDGPPRSTVYGLAVGLTAVSAAASRGLRRAPRIA